MRIMDVAEVESWGDLENKYVRVAMKGWGDSVKIIGNLIDDRWFDSYSFFADAAETDIDRNKESQRSGEE